jgi:alpha-tubulin suppressor-like RCC1 family protein
MHGQLGLSNERNAISPTLVEHLEHKNISAIFANGKNSAVIAEDNSVWTFGSGSNGILGHGDSMDQPNQNAPKEIISLRKKNIQAISVGGFHMLAHDQHGGLWAWGRNNAGQLGLGEGQTGDHGEPQVVNGIEGNIVALASGRMHSLVLTSKGQVYSFGNGRDAQLGLGDKKQRKSPTIIKDLPSNVVSIACGRDSSFALTADGKVWSWGRDDFGQLAHGRGQRFVATPRPVASLDNENIVAIQMGEYHGCAISSEGRIFTWGKNSDGQCGHGHKNNVTQPVQIETFEAMNVAVKQVDCGDGHTAAITDNGDLYVWGRGRSGELGRGTERESNAAYRSVPVKVPITSGTAKMVATGGEHTLCILE